MYELTETGSYELAAVAAVMMAGWLGWRILEWIWLKPKRMEKHLKSQGYHGNPYKVLFGDLKEFSAGNKHARSIPISLSDDIVPRAAPFLHKSINTYGKKSLMWFGRVPRVHITEGELVREVLAKNFKYLKTNVNPMVKLLLPGLLRCDLHQWTKHRKIINPAFHIHNLKLMLPEFHVSCVEMISELEKARKESKEVDVWPFLQTLTADVISRTAFGSSYEEGRKIFQLIKKQADLVIQAVSTPYIPGWRFVPTKRNMRMNKIAKQTDHLLTNLVNNRVNALKSGQYSNKNQDLLNILLDSNSKENGNMTIKEIVQECKLFYFAGQETTAALLVWTMVLLAHHQEWQQRARDEVLQLFGKYNKPDFDFDGLNRLKIVSMIIYEVLRLYPPIVQFGRTINEDMKLGESLHLQAGTMIAVPIILLHHDKEVWGDDAKEFNPERFAQGISNATKLGHHELSYFPFSWGPRVCIGQNFALLEAKMAVAIILQHFSFQLSPSYIHAPSPIITLQPQFGAPLIMHQI